MLDFLLKPTKMFLCKHDLCRAQFYIYTDSHCYFKYNIQITRICAIHHPKLKNKGIKVKSLCALCTLTVAVALSVDGSKQQVAISVAWRNEETLAGFSEITGYQSQSAVHIMPCSLAQGNGSDYSLQALKGNCNLLCWASQKTEELCCPKGLGLFQVIQDRLVKVGKAYSGWLGSETRPPAS